MNQILLTDNQDVKKNSNKFNNNNNSGDIKKIIIFFSIAIFIFAILVICVYVYKISKKDEKTYDKPKLSIEETEDSLKIIAEAEAGIDEIIYIWNNSEPNEIKMNGRTKHEEIIKKPIGTNTLKVKVIDGNNQEIETEKTTYFEDISNKPIIETNDKIGDGKIEITATDEVNTIRYITYKWNNEVETTVEAEDEYQTTLKTIINAKRGKNTLKITAVNGLANSETLEKTFIGVNEPIFDVYISNNNLYINISHDMGIKKVEFIINGEKYIYDENYQEYDSTKKELEFIFRLKEGENLVTIHAISNEEQEGIDGIKNIEATYYGKCTYVP